MIPNKEQSVRNQNKHTYLPVTSRLYLILFHYDLSIFYSVSGIGSAFGCAYLKIQGLSACLPFTTLDCILSKNSVWKDLRFRFRPYPDSMV